MISAARHVLAFLCLSVLLSFQAFGQEVTVVLGPEQIGINELFTIKFTVFNGKIKSNDPFPEIPGFQKQGTSPGSSMTIINGQRSYSNSITQYYKPSRKGQFTLPKFSMLINGQAAASPGKRIMVTDAVASAPSGFNASDPFAEFFGRSEEIPEFVEIADDAFFAVTTNKSEVYVGEGFTMDISFFMSEQNQAPFQFYEAGTQLDAILKKLRPANAWEENFSITTFDPQTVTRKGKKWTKIKVFESTFFPFSEGKIELPRVPWEMIKYKVAKNPSLFGANRQEDFKTFYSSPKIISVKPLPPHPLKSEVPVGIFQLRENITTLEAKTGEGFNYNFGVAGIGNINALAAPKRLLGTNLNIFDPNVRQQINRGYGQISGIKEFDYFATLNEAGEYPLVNYFSWIYFDPEREVYDTLKPQALIRVSGESKINEALSGQRLGGIYDKIATESNQFLNQRYKYYFTNVINVLLLGALILLAVIIIRKK